MTSVDPDQARRLLERELERGEYSGAHVTWWDRASQDVLAWFSSLRPDGVGGVGLSRTLLVVAIVVLVAVVVLVVVSRGLPRRRARLRADDVRGVLDDDDLRSAATIASAARAAMRDGDWSTAVLEGYRAVARGLGERDLVPDVPGATAGAIAVRASRPFPAFRDDLHRAATTFDDVRYLGLDTDEAAARQVLDTEDRLRTARPVRTDGPVVPA